MTEDNGSGGGSPSSRVIDPPASKTETRSGARPGVQPKPSTGAAKFFSRATGRKVLEGAKWVGLGGLILGAGSFIYRKAKGMSWGGSALSGLLHLGPLDPQ